MDMPPKSVERLKRLQNITESSSYAEVLKNALRLYEIIIDEVEAGNEICVKKGNVVSQIHVFAA